MSNGVVCWRTLGVVFGILEAPGDTFGCLGQSLGTFFGIWTAPWATFSDLGGSLGDLVAPNGFQNRLFWILDAFWAPFWEAFGSPGGVWEVIWELFGALWEVFGGCFWVFCLKS